MTNYLPPKEYARHLRRNQTSGERIVWDLVRNRQLRNYKFNRQHIIKIWTTSGRDYFYFADFYCAEKRLVIEVDGGVHQHQMEYDASRDADMAEYGYNVLRITDEEVHTNQIGVLKKIITTIETLGVVRK